MDPRFYDYFSTELFHLRESAAEFAREFPKIASRLAIDGTDCADPYIERLLEGFAFLAARVQLKLDAEFPTFVQHLTEVVYPDYLAPVPSMAIARFEPDFQDSGLAKGVVIPRGTSLRGALGMDAQTAPEFRSGHAVTLWPIELTGVRFEAHAPEFAPGVGWREQSAGALRIRLKVKGQGNFDKLPVDQLDFYFSAEERVASRLYEHVFAYGQNVIVLPQSRQPGGGYLLGSGALRKIGFGDSEALLPVSSRSFRGYRLLREYAAFPARFLFFRIAGLANVIKQCKSDEIEIAIPLSRADADLERLTDQGSISLFATPIVNLFPKQADRIFVDFGSTEYHVVPDRTRPLDFEVHSIRAVAGFGAGQDQQIELRPLYATTDAQASSGGDIFYALRREKRVLSTTQKQRGTRTAYVGTEVFLSIGDTMAPPFPDTLKQLSVDVLCTNRDLAIMLPVNQAGGDFSLAVSAPVKKIRCLRGPSRPIPPALDGDIAWRVISHFSLNYLSLTDVSEAEGAAAMRQMLSLYGMDPEIAMHKQIDGVRSVKVAPIVRRLPEAPTVTFARGHEIELTCDPRYFEGFSPFILASVLEEFFSRYAGINAFTETVLRIQGRGEIKRWTARLGRRPVL
jgi:type VI secretion system protein ImpG